jgi:hypothetical protein
MLEGFELMMSRSEDQGVNDDYVSNNCYNLPFELASFFEYVYSSDSHYAPPAIKFVIYNFSNSSIRK